MEDVTTQHESHISLDLRPDGVSIPTETVNKNYTFQDSLPSPIAHSSDDRREMMTLEISRDVVMETTQGSKRKRENTDNIVTTSLRR